MGFNLGIVGLPIPRNLTLFGALITALDATDWV